MFAENGIDGLVAGRPGADVPDPGPTVCSCLNVGANTILDAIANGAIDADRIGAATGAGTNCGSCRSEIGRLCDARILEAAE